MANGMEAMWCAAMAFEARCRRIGALGLDALLHAWQVIRQGLALWRAAGLIVRLLVCACAAAPCNAASCASRLAWSAAQVSSKRLRCSAFMRLGVDGLHVEHAALFKLGRRA